MKSKLMLLGFGLILLSSNKFNAATVYASDGTIVENTSNVCANDVYYYQLDDTGMYEADIVSAETRQLLATSNSSYGEIEFSFPSNAGDLIIYIYQYGDASKELVDSFELTISDCNYEPVVEDYKPLNIKTTITKTETGYQFTKPDFEDYNLYINQLEKNDDGNSKQVKFKNGVADIEFESDVIQITETFINTKGKAVEQFYEIDLIDEPIIRKISGIELSIIQPMDYLDKQVVIRILIGFIVLIVLYLTNRMLIRKLRFKKSNKRKSKLYQIQQQQEAKKKKEQAELRRKQKQEYLKQKKLESQRRANLKIKK